MISIVTTTAVSLLNDSAIAGSFVVIAMLVLVALLVQKEILSTADDNRTRQLSRVMDIGILPLLMAFGLIVFFKIVESLN